MKSKIMYILISVLVILTGCSSQSGKQETSVKKYDIAIFDRDNITTFINMGERLEKVETIKRAENYGFMPNEYAYVDNGTIFKTSVVSGKSTQLLANINKETLVINTKSDGNSHANFSASNDKIFVLDNLAVTDKFKIFVYDKNFEKLQEREIFKEGEFVARTMLATDDAVYLLVSKVTGGHGFKNYIWKLNASLDAVEEIELADSYYYSGLVIKGNYMYVTQQATEFSVDKTHGLVKVDIATHEKEFIKLNNPYPMNVYADDEHNRLVIVHYVSGVFNYMATVYDLTTGEQIDINFSDVEKNSNESAFFNQDKENYYFLFENMLVRYNKEAINPIKHDLTSYGIKTANVLVVG